MRPKRIQAATAAVIAVAIVLAACGDDEAQTAGQTERTLRLSEGQPQMTNIIDTPPRTFNQEEGSPGDSWVFTKPLRDESGKPAGDVYATCVAFTLGSNPKSTCDGTLQLKQGTLAFTQVFNIQDESRRAAITGGTGAFAGATGALRAGGELGQGYEIKLFLP